MARAALLMLVTILISGGASWLLWGDPVKNAAALPLAPGLRAPTVRERQFGVMLAPEASAFLERQLPADYAMPQGALADGVRDMAGAAGKLPVFFNWRAIEAAGGKRDARVAVGSVAGMSFGDAILKVLAAQQPPLACTIDDGVLTVSTRDDLSNYTVTRVYDVRPFCRTNAEVQSLLNDIQANVAPQSWRTAEPRAEGSLQTLSGQLIVTQTEIAQYEVRSYLNRLHRRRSMIAFLRRAGALTGSAVAIVSLALVGRAFVQRRRRLRTGLCPTCGYDLRASNDRCPECGTAIGCGPAAIAP